MAISYDNKNIKIVLNSDQSRGFVLYWNIIVLLISLAVIGIGVYCLVDGTRWEEEWILLIVVSALTVISAIAAIAASKYGAYSSICIALVQFILLCVTLGMAVNGIKEENLEEKSRDYREIRFILIYSAVFVAIDGVGACFLCCSCCVLGIAAGISAEAAKIPRDDQGQSIRQQIPKFEFPPGFEAFCDNRRFGTPGSPPPVRRAESDPGQPIDTDNTTIDV